MPTFPRRRRRDRTVPPLRSVPAFLWWQARRQTGTLVAGIFFGVVWMACQAAWPYLLGRSIDEVVGSDGSVLGWMSALLAVVAVQTVAHVMRHRMAVNNWLAASLGTARLIGYHVAHAGRAVTARTAAGEVVSTVATDSIRLGAMFDVVARLAGAVVAYVGVVVVVLTVSPALGVAVALAMPVAVVTLAPLIRPLHARQARQRADSGRLTTLGADTVVGLRILRGIGGEDTFVDRYAGLSQTVRRSGVAVARTQSWLDGLQVLLPGALVAGVVWYGGQLALAGELTAGQLVALFGYATFLTIPLRTGTEAVQVFTNGLVATRRILDVLRIDPGARTRHAPSAGPPASGALVDLTSGLVVEPDTLTAIVDPDPDAAATLADRLGALDAPGGPAAGVLWGDVELGEVALDEIRDRIVISEAYPHLFTGPLHDALDVRARRSQGTQPDAVARTARIHAAIETASATDIVQALPAGLDTRVAERGRAFSGGQRQRLALARALLTDAEVLVLVEPTSAVDAHTEARIIDRVREARSGRTTVVVSTSPLVLDKADTVVVMEHGRVLGAGRHADLLRRQDAIGGTYRSLVSRTDTPDAAPGASPPRARPTQEEDR